MKLNNKSRMLSVMLLITALASAAVSCGDAVTDGAVTEADGNAETDAVTEAVTEDPALMDNLPETDMGGEAFRMTIFGDEERRAQTYYEAEDGNIVNDAVYNKIRTVEDRFHRAASHIDGAMSIMTGICANKSIATGMPVNVLDEIDIPGYKKH